MNELIEKSNKTSRREDGGGFLVGHAQCGVDFKSLLLSLQLLLVLPPV